tara:strand:+ start:75 stop:1250 length:1176 start_codon:yes stop_codon:yes gene_type:complete
VWPIPLTTCLNRGCWFVSILLVFVITHADASPEHRQSLRELGVTVGTITAGEFNAITDVPGVRVGHTTLHKGQGLLIPGHGPVRTGVTVIIPRENVWNHKVPAGAFVLNGTGEMTGLAWIEEAGFLEYPIALTNTLNAPLVSNGVISWMLKKYPAIGITDDTLTPLVAECDDSYLNDIQGRHVTEHDVMLALESASSGSIKQGSVGAGTGMRSYGFKGGIGTSSRILPSSEGGYVVGVLVNANHGRRDQLTILGHSLTHNFSEVAPPSQKREGSIIIIIATNAPLTSRQLKRVAKRATFGLARTGTIGRHGSGDFILAFSTGNTIPHYPVERTYSMTIISDTYLNPIFSAVVEATEEAILNALALATTTVGRDGHRAEAIPLKQLRQFAAP